MRAHLVQFDIAWEDKEANFRRVRSLIRGALAGGSMAPFDLVVLPEMFDTGFSFNTDTTADHPDKGVTLGFLRDLAHQTKTTVQGARSIMGPDGKGRNLATIVNPRGEVIAEYAKVHPFSYGREPERFSGGDKVVTYTWTRPPDEPVTLAPASPESCTVCPAICYDLRFPELFRRGLQSGAEVFAIGANWPAVRASHWRALLVARAIENQAVVLGVNRTGDDPNLHYEGDSIAVGPKGEVLEELDSREGVLSIEVPIVAVRECRAAFPAWRDIRLLRS
jgi:predicted amidohydrolase